MKNSLKKLVDDKPPFFVSLLYAGTGVLPKGIEFLLLPLWTRYLSVSEFGLVALVLVASRVVASFSSMGIGGIAAQDYYKNKGDVEKRNCIISTSFYYLSFVSLLFIVLSACVYLVTKWVGGVQIPSIWLIALCTLLPFQMISAYGGNFAMLKDEVKISVTVPFIGTAIGVLLGVILVVYMEMGAEGRILSLASSFCIMAVLYFLFSLRQHLTWVFSRSELVRMLKLGAPLIIHSAAGSVVILSDRFFIKHYSGDEELGFYSFASTVCMLVPIASTALVTAWRSKMYGYWKEGTGEGNIRAFDQWLLSIGSASFLLILLSSTLVKLLATEEYEHAGKIIPYLTMAMLFQGLYFFAALRLTFKERIKLLSKISFFSALLNIALNFWLVPLYGSIGAAIATMLSILLMCLVAYYHSWEDLDKLMNRGGVFVFFATVMSLLSLITASGECFSVPNLVIVICYILAQICFYRKKSNEIEGV